jgi:cell division protein FtsL
MKGISKRREFTGDDDRKFSRKLRLLNKVEVVILLVIAVITLSSVLALTHHKSHTLKKAQTIKEVNEKATKDVRKSLTKEEPKAKKAKKP